MTQGEGSSFAVVSVFHASELLLLFGMFPEVEREFATQMADYYINFVADLHPGGELLHQLASTRARLIISVATWPQYDLSSRKLLQLKRDNITVITDGESLCDPS